MIAENVDGLLEIAEFNQRYAPKTIYPNGTNNLNVSSASGKPGRRDDFIRAQARGDLEQERIEIILNDALPPPPGTDAHRDAMEELYQQGYNNGVDLTAYDFEQLERDKELHDLFTDHGLHWMSSGNALQALRLATSLNLVQ